MSAHVAPVSRRGQPPPLTVALARVASGSWLGVTIAAAVAAICFGATGGLESTDGTGLAPNVTAQIAMTLGGCLLLAVSAILQPSRRMRAFGLAPAIALVVLAAYTALSIAWSVNPAGSWLEASRTFAYAATFVGAIALARLMAAQWRSVLAGVLAAMVALSVYALATKVFPATLDSGDPAAFARLQMPFGYWNAVGLAAALGIGPCLWLGTRRDGHGVVRALAAPALCLLIVTLMLSYSRGALIAAALGTAFWLIAVPLRLRALALIAIGGLCAAVAVVWAFRQPWLTKDGVALPDRTYAGHRLGLIVLGMVLLAFAAALVVGFAAARNPLSPSRRRALGIAVLVALALVPFAAVGALAASSRGLTGTIDHAWNTLTSSGTPQPSSSPSRLIAAGNDHALYWRLALDVFRRSPVVGAGAGSYPVADQRFMTGPALADQAHSYVFQTLADLGLVGLALSLVLLALWARAAVRTTALFRRRAPENSAPERIGLLSMVAVVITFTVHSAVDWTWFVPGLAVVALICAGWVAGRGPHTERAAPPHRSWTRPAVSPLAAAVALAAVAIALITAFAQWQPLRSEQAASAGAIALGNSATTQGIALACATPSCRAHYGALEGRQLAQAEADELTATARDPLDIVALADLGYVYAAQGRDHAALDTFRREVTMQPSNSQSWLDLANYESAVSDGPAAQHALATALYLNPQGRGLERQYIETLRK